MACVLARLAVLLYYYPVPIKQLKKILLVHNPHNQIIAGVIDEYWARFNQWLVSQPTFQLESNSINDLCLLFGASTLKSHILAM